MFDMYNHLFDWYMTNKYFFILLLKKNVCVLSQSEYNF